MSKKICSIVYVGLKTGIKFVEGKFSPANSSYKTTPKLDKLCNEFKEQLGDNAYSDAAIDEMAREFLKKHGYIVKYSDYDERCVADNESMMSESMSDDDVKKFLKLARNDEVKFKFKEVKDGSTRTAHGTLKKDIIQKEIGDVKKAKRKHRVPASIIVYWDLDKKSWRSFRKANFIKFLK